MYACITYFALLNCPDSRVVVFNYKIYYLRIIYWFQAKLSFLNFLICILVTCFSCLVVALNLRNVHWLTYMTPLGHVVA
jgi:hypothetical protein